MTKASRERGLERAIKILDCLHEHGRPMVVNELAAAMKAPRSTVYELTKFLLDRSVLDSYGDGGRVFLGRKLFFYGQAFQRAYPLIELAEPVIDRLARESGELAELCALVDWKQYILYAAEGPRPYWFKPYPGGKYPLPLSATGRFLIAGIDEAILRSRIPEEDYCLNGRQLLTLERFLADSAAARERGYSVVSGLVDPYLASVAMPIADSGGKVVAAVGLAFPTGELEANEERFVRVLSEAQARIEAALSRADRGEPRSTVQKTGRD